LVGFDLSDQMNAGGGGLLECFFWQCMASTVTTEPVSASEASKVWTAGISWTFRRSRDVPVGSKGAEYVRSTAVEKVVEASSQGLAIDRHMPLTFAVCRVVQHGGMAAERTSTEVGSSFVV
jgi:hypothetical protein